MRVESSLVFVVKSVLLVKARQLPLINAAMQVVPLLAYSTLFKALRPMTSFGVKPRAAVLPGMVFSSE